MNYYYVIQSEAFRIFLRFFVASLLGMTDKVFLCDASLSSEPVIASKAQFTAAAKHEAGMRRQAASLTVAVPRIIKCVVETAYLKIAEVLDPGYPFDFFYIFTMYQKRYAAAYAELSRSRTYLRVHAFAFQRAVHRSRIRMILK